MDDEDEVSLDALPDALVQAIFGLLSPVELAQAACVCTRWRLLSTEAWLWRPLVRSAFPVAFSRSPPDAEALRPWFAERSAAAHRWDRAQPLNVHACLGHLGTVFGVAAVPASATPGAAAVLSGGEDGIVRTWSLHDGSLLAETELHAHAGIFSIATWTTGAGEARVAVTAFDGDVSVAGWGADGRLDQSSAVTLAGHHAPVVSSHARGRMLATCSFDGSIRLWDADAAWAARVAASETGAESARTPREGGQHFIHTSCLSVLRDPADGQAPDAHGASVSCVCLPPASTTLLVRGGNDTFLRTWDVETGKQLRVLPGHRGWVWSLVTVDEADPHLFLSGSVDASVRAWDFRTPTGTTAMMEIPGAGPVAGLCVRPGGRYFATGTFEDAAVRLFDLRRMVGERAVGGASPLVGTALRGHTDRVTRIVATDAAVVSASFDSTVRIWSFDEL